MPGLQYVGLRPQFRALHGQGGSSLHPPHLVNSIAAGLADASKKDRIKRLKSLDDTPLTGVLFLLVGQVINSPEAGDSISTLRCVMNESNSLPTVDCELVDFDDLPLDLQLIFLSLSAN